MFLSIRVDAFIRSDDRDNKNKPTGIIQWSRIDIFFIKYGV